MNKYFKCCRVCKCAIDGAEGVNKEYVAMFTFCTAIKIERDDTVSPLFCSVCSKQLENCYNFIKRCRTTDKELRAYFNSLDVKDEPEIKSENEIDDFNDFENDDDRPIQALKESLIKLECNSVKSEKKRKKRKKKSKFNTNDIIEISKKKVVKKLYQCPVCNVTMLRAKPLSVHMKKEHPDYKKHKCHVCDKGFRYPFSLKLHLIKHSDEKKFECDICHKVYKFRGALRIHIESHMFGLHKCSKCDKSFQNWQALKTHKSLHTGQKPHLCETCGKGFAVVANLKVHMRVHSGERPYGCTLCPYTTSFYATYRRHKLTHTKSERKPCKTCGKDFSDLGSLKRHIRLHTGDLPYKCEYCKMRFIDGWKRRVHIAKQHNIQLADIPHLEKRRNTTKIILDSDDEKTNRRNSPIMFKQNK